MTERASGSAGDWFYLNRIRALWAVGGIIVSIVAAIITTTLYVNDLLARIKRLELQTTAINEALSFGNKIEQKNVTFNGNEEDPKCAPGYGINVSEAAESETLTQSLAPRNANSASSNRSQYRRSRSTALRDVP